MIKAVIFDMDGLIIDSESMQSNAFEAVLQEYGVKPTPNEEGIVHTVGVSGRDNWRELKEEYGIDEDTTALLKKKREAYLDLLEEGIQPMKGFMDLLNLLRDKKVKLAVASSSTLEQIETILSTLGVIDYFDVIVGGEHVTRGKPAPDIFLEAAEKLGVVPEDCLVLEDSESGVEAAEKVGMRVIAVPNQYTVNHDFSKADQVVNSLADIDWRAIESV